MDSMTGRKKKKHKKPTLAMTDLKRNSMSLFQLLSAAYCSLWGDLQSILQINISQVLQFNSNWLSGFRED
jgi:hypothetical protein